MLFLSSAVFSTDNCGGIEAFYNHRSSFMCYLLSYLGSRFLGKKLVSSCFPSFLFFYGAFRRVCLKRRHLGTGLAEAAVHEYTKERGTPQS